MSKSAKKLGTIEGVFVPTTMTILGVILFVRTGWIVGQVGLLGALGVIVAAFAVSTATALSLSSIVTNVRVDAGGAFALLTRTLGIEPGASIGVPLYLAQALAIPLYVFGFREGWRQIFPDHAAGLVDGAVFVVVFGIAAISARFAFRLQFVVLLVLASAIVAFVGGLTTHPLHEPTWWVGDGAGPYAAFGVFFPAVTGIMAGVNMSGELASPRRSIVRGNLAAIAVTFVTYLIVAACAALLIDPTSLRKPGTALADHAVWPPLLLAGLLSATFSSALSTAVGAPRILAALGASGVVPGGRWFGELGWWGQPHRALGATALVAGVGVALRDLNAIAPLITLFFLLTYAAINGTLLVQQALELPRFRPSFRVPLVVPAVGTVGCLVGMIAVSPLFTGVALVCIAMLYGLLMRRRPEGPFGQVRAGAVVALLAWALGRLADLPGDRAWQAHQLVPVWNAASVRGLAPLLGTLARRGGSVALLEVGEVEGMEEAVDALHSQGMTVRVGKTDAREGLDTVQAAIDVLSAALLPPNLLMLALPGPQTPWGRPEGLQPLIDEARTRGIGLWLASLHEDGEDAGAPWPKVTIWLEARGIRGPMTAEGLSLVLLAAWRVRHAFGAPVEIVALLDPEASDEDERFAHADVERVAENARIPGLQTDVRRGTAAASLEQAAEALHLFVALSPALRLDELDALRRSASGQLVVACLSGDLEGEEG